MLGHITMSLFAIAQSHSRLTSRTRALRINPATIPKLRILVGYPDIIDVYFAGRRVRFEVNKRGHGQCWAGTIGSFAIGTRKGQDS